MWALLSSHVPINASHRNRFRHCNLFTCTNHSEFESIMNTNVLKTNYKVDSRWMRATTVLVLQATIYTDISTADDHKVFILTVSRFERFCSTSIPEFTQSLAYHNRSVNCVPNTNVISWIIFKKVHMHMCVYPGHHIWRYLYLCFCYKSTANVKSIKIQLPDSKKYPTLIDRLPYHPTIRDGHRLASSAFSIESDGTTIILSYLKMSKITPRIAKIVMGTAILGRDTTLYNCGTFFLIFQHGLP